MAQRTIGFYTDREKRVRPVTQRGVSRQRYAQAQRSITIQRTRRKKDTLENPLLYANHKRWIKQNTDPDAYDKVDWDSEIDRKMTPSESREALREKYPEAFYEEGPSRFEIRERMKREREIDELYREYEASFRKKELAVKREKTVKKIKTRMEKLPPERRAKILREKPKLRREPLLREIVIQTKSGRKYTRVRKVWKY